MKANDEFKAICAAMNTIKQMAIDLKVKQRA
jgi:hypothetical protein